MVVGRYPHTATITAVTTTITDGKAASETPSSSTIKGRLEPSEGTSRVKDPDGEYTNIKGKFFTKSEAITGAKTLTVNGRTFQIIDWWPFQTYSEIWLD